MRDGVAFGMNRRAMLAGLFAALLPSPGIASPCRPVRVLFVCEAGTVKSAIAREALRKRVALLRLPVLVQSRGLAPENHVTPLLAERLRADGIDTTADPVRALTADDLTHADIVVAFDDASRSPLLSKARAWRTPSWISSYEAARLDLSQRLDALVSELRNAPACAGRAD